MLIDKQYIYDKIYNEITFNYQLFSKYSLTNVNFKQIPTLSRLFIKIIKIIILNFSVLTEYSNIINVK